MNQESRQVLDYLLSARLSETDPWYADDIAIAAKTVKLAAEGCPRPHHVATMEILGIAPELVWPRIVADRKAKLGKLYTKFYDASTDLPRPEEEERKPPTSERPTTTARKSQRG
jgi:hypothetical protein